MVTGQTNNTFDNTVTDLGSRGLPNKLNFIIVNSSFTGYTQNPALKIYDRGDNSNGFNNSKRVTTKILETEFSDSKENAPCALDFSLIN